jgi:hypothetical protein
VAANDAHINTRAITPPAMNPPFLLLSEFFEEKISRTIATDNITIQLHPGIAGFIIY